MMKENKVEEEKNRRKKKSRISWIIQATPKMKQDRICSRKETMNIKGKHCQASSLKKTNYIKLMQDQVSNHRETI